MALKDLADRLSLSTRREHQPSAVSYYTTTEGPTSEPSKMGSASEARLSPGVAGLVGLLSTWSNSTKMVTPGLKPNSACYQSRDRGAATEAKPGCRNRSMCRGETARSLVRQETWCLVLRATTHVTVHTCSIVCDGVRRKSRRRPTLKSATTIIKIPSRWHPQADDTHDGNKHRLPTHPRRHCSGWPAARRRVYYAAK